MKSGKSDPADVPRSLDILLERAGAIGDAALRQFICPPGLT